MDDQTFQHYIDPDTPVDSKLFFNIHIYAIDNSGAWQYLAFHQNGSQEYLASRVLRGGTLRAAMTKELESNLHLEKDRWEFCRPIEYSDDTRDNSGIPVQRVHVYVKVPYRDVTGMRALGMDVQWIGAELTAESESEEQAAAEYTGFKNLQDSDIEQLGLLLGVQFNFQEVEARRSKYPDEPIIFEELILEEFSPELNRMYVGGGNHWTIWNIFPDIKKAVPELDLGLPDNGETVEGDEWVVAFTTHGEKQRVVMEPLNFWPLFDQLNDLLKPFHKHFMYYDDFAEGGPSFLLVADCIDEARFKAMIYQPTKNSQPSDENAPEANVLNDPEIKAILEEYDLLGENYQTKRDVFETLDEIANEWLLNDLSNAEAKDLAETDAVVRKSARNANVVKAKIYDIELKMKELNPEYKPSAYKPMQLKDWNPPRDDSADDFYKEFVYHFGDDESKIGEAVELYMRYHPEVNKDDVKSQMAGSTFISTPSGEERVSAAKATLDASLIADLRSGQKKGVPELWSAFTVWLSKASPEQHVLLNPPASEDDFEKFKALMGYDLPENIKQLYQLNNGGPTFGPNANLILEWGFLSVDGIIDWIWRSPEELADPGFAVTYPPGDAIKRIEQSPKWIPLLYDYGGNYVSVDLDPGTSGVVGQIIICGRDDHMRKVEANSIEDYLANLLLQFADNNVIVDPDQDYSWSLTNDWY